MVAFYDRGSVAFLLLLSPSLLYDSWMEECFFPTLTLHDNYQMVCLTCQLYLMVCPTDNTPVLKIVLLGKTQLADHVN